MRNTLLIFAIVVAGCSTQEKQNPFDELVDESVVTLYLQHYQLDSVPPDVLKLRAATHLSIMKDTTSGWTIYPPLSAISQTIVEPPFRQLPPELGELKNLQSLALVGLDLVALPESMKNLQHLDTLDLTLNKLTIANEVETLSQLTNLRYLAVLGNKVDSIDIQNLKAAIPNLTTDIDAQ